MSLYRRWEPKRIPAEDWLAIYDRTRILPLVCDGHQMLVDLELSRANSDGTVGPMPFLRYRIQAAMVSDEISGRQWRARHLVEVVEQWKNENVSLVISDGPITGHKWFTVWGCSLLRRNIDNVEYKKVRYCGNIPMEKRVKMSSFILWIR